MSELTYDCNPLGILIIVWGRNVSYVVLKAAYAVFYDIVFINFTLLVKCWGCVTFASEKRVKGRFYSSTGLAVETWLDFGLAAWGTWPLALLGSLLALAHPGPTVEKWLLKQPSIHPLYRRNVSYITLGSLRCFVIYYFILQNLILPGLHVSASWINVINMNR